MKKVAIVIGDAFSYAGTENVCNYMTDCLGDDCLINILSLSGNGKPFYPYQKVNKIITFNDYKKPLIEIKKNILENDYDTVFVVSMGKLSFLFRLLFLTDFSIKRRTRFIACEHIAFDSFNMAIKLLKILSLKWYDLVVVLTDLDKGKFLKAGVKVVKINNPIHFRYHVKEQRYFTALSVGRLNNQKGFDRLLKIWSIFSKGNDNWVLNIAGDGELMDELKSLAIELGIENKVNFLGKINNLETYYKQSDVFLMTSRYEGLPMVLLEAKSWSLPVIAYDCPTGPREIINNNTDGYLIKDDDHVSFIEKLNEISVSDATLYELSASASETFKPFDSEMVKLQWRSIISASHFKNDNN
ncbi:glycosyltransferase [Erwinia sp. S43]|uniref:glycosyltransferase n=1 Tax=Erwinia sp. S43 TaxID=2769339 RepID=UPI00190E5747|nr:glycosyltransferase [Erwinia sp. S43]MBK0033752.1 glycosyltransferase [Erwinia sp. S43]